MSGEAAEEIHAHLARAEETLGAARTLIEAGYFDDAASRAYYAAFHAATAALLAEGVRFKKHSGVLSGVGRHFVKTGRLSTQIGRDLNWLYDLRLLGDYGEIRHVPKEEAEKALTTGETLVAALRRLIPDS